VIRADNTIEEGVFSSDLTTKVLFRSIKSNGEVAKSALDQKDGVIEMKDKKSIKDKILSHYQSAESDESLNYIGGTQIKMTGYYSSKSGSD